MRPDFVDDAHGGPLQGVRVIECGSLIAGPFCGQLLGDFGAEVIKVEDPGRGDPMRLWGQVRPSGQSLHWPIVGRNKKSVTLDLRRLEGQAIFRSLADRADIVVENFRPGTLEKWGLGYEALTSDNVGLVLVRVSGYGQTGPYATRAGFGAIGEAMGVSATSPASRIGHQVVLVYPSVTHWQLHSRLSEPCLLCGLGTEQVEGRL